jgi:hypothetical protein
MTKQRSTNETKPSYEEMEFGSIAVLDEEAEIPTIYDRICDTDCPKSGCGGLCKISGDANGSHSPTPHTCNKCQHSW